jgi:hypothetical protein
MCLAKRQEMRTLLRFRCSWKDVVEINVRETVNEDVN